VVVVSVYMAKALAAQVEQEAVTTATPVWEEVVEETQQALRFQRATDHFPDCTAAVAPDQTVHLQSKAGVQMAQYA